MSGFDPVGPGANPGEAASFSFVLVVVLLLVLEAQFFDDENEAEDEDDFNKEQTPHACYVMRDT